jgi:hypothetical protein
VETSKINSHKKGEFKGRLKFLKEKKLNINSLGKMELDYAWLG